MLNFRFFFLYIMTLFFDVNVILVSFLVSTTIAILVIFGNLQPMYAKVSLTTFKYLSNYQKQ